LSGGIKRITCPAYTTGKHNHFVLQAALGYFVGVFFGWFAILIIEFDTNHQTATTNLANVVFAFSKLHAGASSFFRPTFMSALTELLFFNHLNGGQRCCA
jgi:hypothetical protein